MPPVGTVRVECPQTAQTWDVPLRADFVRAPRVGAALVLDRSGSMSEDGGDGRTRLQVLLDAAPAFVDIAPPAHACRPGPVRDRRLTGRADDDDGPEGSEPGAMPSEIRSPLTPWPAARPASPPSATAFTTATRLIAPEAGLDDKALVVLTDGRENRDRYLADVAGLINDRVYAIGLGTPEQIDPVALDTLTNGSGGYLLMTGVMDVNDPFRLEKYYLQILAGVTNDQIVLDPDGWLSFGGGQVIPFHLNEADMSVDAIVLVAAPRLVRARLRTPAGQIFDENHPSLKWTVGRHVGFFRFTLPVPGPSSFEGPGRWELLLDWRRKPNPDQINKAATTGAGRHGLQYTVLIHARSELQMATTVVQSGRTPGAHGHHPRAPQPIRECPGRWRAGARAHPLSGRKHPHAVALAPRRGRIRGELQGQPAGHLHDSDHGRGAQPPGRPVHPRGGADGGGVERGRSTAATSGR